jgi:transcriptional regulator with XRE-family HTH domain
MEKSSNFVAGELMRQIRRESGLKQIELARRSGISSSVLSAYEHGGRQPAVSAMARIARAAGLELRVTPSSEQAEMLRAGEILSQVLDLAERLPYRPREQLGYPALLHTVR